MGHRLPDGGPRAAQTEPKNQQNEPQGAAKSEKPTKLPSKGG